MLQIIKSHPQSKVAILIFVICFVVFVYSNDGHRYTFDEDVAEQESFRIATWKDDPTYVQGESRIFFEYPWLYPPEHNSRPICQNGILCSASFIGHSLLQVPFILLNHNFHFVSDDIKWNANDFDDLNYLYWRNSINPDLTFVELFFGPFFSALSVALLFLIIRSYGISLKNSVLLSLIYAFCTVAWAYSQTSLNAVPMTFFVLLGFYFFRGYQTTNSSKKLILSGISFGFGFLIRPDSVLFIIPVFFLVLFLLRTRKNKFKSFLSFVIPTISSYGINHLISYVRIGFSTNDVSSTASNILKGPDSNPYLLNVFGLLFSPGVGLFIFSPILCGLLVGFYDFFKQKKQDCTLIIAISSLFILAYASGDTWHGLVGWGPRYLVPLIPFLIIPLCFSFEKRGNFFKLIILILAGIGFFINLTYILQDVNWFVWGFFGDDSRGLASLARKDDGSVYSMWLNPLVIWSFEYSQLTQAVMWMFNKLQLDIFLLKALGFQAYVVSLLSFLGIALTMLIKTIRANPNDNKIQPRFME